MTAVPQYKVLDVNFAAGPDPMSVANAVGVKESTIAEWYAGCLTSAGGLADISGNGRDLTPHGTPLPSPVDSFILGHDRRPIQNFVLDGSSQYFDRANEPSWMDFALADYSVTMLVKSPSVSGGMNRYFCNHGIAVTGGYGIYIDTSGYFTMQLQKVGNSMGVNNPVNKLDGLTHLVTWNRFGTALTCYCDGAVGGSGNPSTFGIVATTPFYLGSFSTPANYLNGGIIYFRVSGPMTDDQRAFEHYYWRGLLTGMSSKRYILPTFSRAQSSTAERKTGPKKIINTVETGWAVKMSEGGLLIQPTVSQVLERTKEFDEATKWKSLEYSISQLMGAPSAYPWMDIKTSSSGQYVVAFNTYMTRVYYSIDYGATWNYHDRNTDNGACVAISPSGQYMVISCNPGYIWTSNNYGTTWTKQLGSGSKAWRACCVADNGNMACGVYNGNIWTSSDEGVTWVEQANSEAGRWYHIACSGSDMQYIIAAKGNGSTNLRVSSNYGVDWNARGSSLVWYGADCDLSGEHMVASEGSHVWISDDYGATWSQVYTHPSGYSFNHVACSGNDGQQLITCTEQLGFGCLYASPNRGTNWYYVTNSASLDWVAADLTADGKDFYAGAKYQTFRMYAGDYFNLDTTVANAATPLAPDGSTDMHSLIAGTEDIEHGVFQAQTLTAAVYTLEADIEVGDKNWAYLRDRTVSNAYAFFDLANRKVGTIGAGCRASVHPDRNRVAIHFTGTAASHNLQISPANADNDVDFAGDGSTPSIKVWEASCHLGGFQLMPINRVAVAASRAGDQLYYPVTFFTDMRMGNSYQTKKLRFQLRVKCLYNSVDDIGTNNRRPFFCIGGNTGTATSTRNMIRIAGYNQYVYVSFYGDDLSATQHWMRYTVADAAQYHVYEFTLDFTELANSTFTKDGVNYLGGVDAADMSGAFDLDVTNCLLRAGMDYDGGIAGFCELDYLRVFEVRA